MSRRLLILLGGRILVEFHGVKKVYSESGVDLTLLRSNLNRSVEERWENNRRAVEFCHAMDESNPLLPPSSHKPGTFDAASLLRCLVDGSVGFVLIGGLAMRTHGSAHITEDVDVCYSRTPENCANLARALSPLHPYLRGAPPGLPFHFDL